MKKNIFLAILAVSVFVFNSSLVNAAVPSKIKRVVIIGCDGMSVGGVMKANTPNFDKFAKQGAYTFHARNIFPTVSSPNWAAMLTGSDATQTGVTSNDWELDNYQLPPVITVENGRYPDIFYILKKFKPQLKTASVYDWGGFGRLYDKNCVDVDIHPEGVVATALKAAEVIKKDSVVVYKNTRYRGYVYINPSNMKVIKTTYSEEGMSVDNVYYDNVVHICVYEGKKLLYGKDIKKQMFSNMFSSDFIDQAVLADMKFMGVNSKGYHYQAILSIPESYIYGIVNLTIDEDKKLTMSKVGK